MTHHTTTAPSTHCTHALHTDIRRISYRYPHANCKQHTSHADAREAARVEDGAKAPML